MIRTRKPFATWVLALAALAPCTTPAAPPPGHPTPQQAGRILDLPPSAGQSLPNAGTVQQTLEANNYTYVEVLDRGAIRWLAVPRMTLARGDRIHFGEGTIMTDFHSRKLRITFPSIMFVNAVEVVPR